MRLTPTSMAHRGEAVARVDGKAHFVGGAIPGESIEGDVVRDKGSWARVELRRVLDPSPHRVEPRCAHFSRCGGCQWQFADYATQLAWKTEVVEGQLRHLGGVDSPAVRPTAAVGNAYHYRNRMDFDVLDGKPSLHRRGSNRLETIGACDLLLPQLAELFAALGDLGSAQRVTLRIGATTGERHLVVRGGPPPPADRWDAAVSHITPSGFRRIRGSGVIHENIDGVRLRISGAAFFQANTAGIPVLLELVSEALQRRRGETLLDAYAGGGLFATTLAPESGKVIAIEASALATRDLRHNLAASSVRDYEVIRDDVENAMGRLEAQVDVAVADPPRAGLGRRGVAAIAAAAPRALAYVSCDPASLGRDTSYLREHGYELRWAAPVDLFPQTFHVETVAAFEPATR